MPIAPTRFSLPRAAALTVKDMKGFSRTARQRLIRQGIVSGLMLAEIASRDPGELRRRTGVTATRARRILQEELGDLPDFGNVAICFQPTPASGLALGAPAGRSTAGMPSVMDWAWLDARLDALTGLPTSWSLVTRMQAVRNQGCWPTCVGHAVAAMREYTLRCKLSPAYSYLGSKTLDGLACGGTWMGTALQWQYRFGQVDEATLPYGKLNTTPDLSQFLTLASSMKSAGHSWLIPHRRLNRRLPELIKALVSGTFAEWLAPVPVGFSMMLYQSFVSTASALDGLIPLPLPNEPKTGGHAMVVVGYLDADDPANPFGLDYMIVRNSWGEDWACHSPAAPGHAMIPADYFRTDAIHEAYIVIENPT